MRPCNWWLRIWSVWRVTCREKKKKQLIFVFFIWVRCLYRVTLTNRNWGWHKEGGREDHTVVCGGQDYPSGCQPDLDLIKAIVKLPSETLEEGQAKKPSFWERSMGHFKFFLVPSLHIKPFTPITFLFSSDEKSCGTRHNEEGRARILKAWDDSYPANSSLVDHPRSKKQQMK